MFSWLRRQQKKPRRQVLFDADPAVNRKLPESSEQSLQLDRWIRKKKWDEVYEAFQKNPELAREPVSRCIRYYRGTKLHYLCEFESAMPEIIDLVASIYPEAVTKRCGGTRFNRSTPLHQDGIYSNPATSTAKFRALFRHINSPDQLLIQAGTGYSVLHTACRHSAELSVLKDLVEASPAILHIRDSSAYKSHALSLLPYSRNHAALDFCQQNMAHILEGRTTSMGEPLEAFWEKISFLAIESYRQEQSCPESLGNESDFLLHALLCCDAHPDLLKASVKLNPSVTRAIDGSGNLPLHVAINKYDVYRNMKGPVGRYEVTQECTEDHCIIETILEANPAASLVPNNAGEFPLFLSLRKKIQWENGIKALLEAGPQVLEKRDPVTGMFPYQFAAVFGAGQAMDVVYTFLLFRPDLLEQLRR